jgi:hypothetical protein
VKREPGAAQPNKHEDVATEKVENDMWRGMSAHGETSMDTLRQRYACIDSSRGVVAVIPGKGCG